MLRRSIKNAPDVDFVIIYTREPHARQFGFKDIMQPTTWEERRDLAERTRDETGLDALFLVDDMGDPSRALFGDLPNPAIFVTRDGRVTEKFAWADASLIDHYLTEWRERKPQRALPEPQQDPVKDLLKRLDEIRSRAAPEPQQDPVKDLLKRLDEIRSRLSERVEAASETLVRAIQAPFRDR